MTIFYKPLGSDFQVNTTTLNAQEQPTVTALAGGGYLVTWIDDKTGHMEGDFYVPGYESVGQLFDAAGNAIGVEFSVGGMSGDPYTGYGRPPVITELASGGFVAIWQLDEAQNAIAQIYDSSGAPVGSMFELPNVISNVFTADSLPSGGFVVTSLYYNNVLTQTFDSEGTIQPGQPFSESPTYDYLPAQAVTSLPSGGFVVSHARAVQGQNQMYDLVAQVSMRTAWPLPPNSLSPGTF